MKSKFFEEVEDKPKLKKCSRKDCINPNVNSFGYLPIEEFGRDARSPDGLGYKCKLCDSQGKLSANFLLRKQWHNKICEHGYGQCLTCGETDMDVMNYHHFNPSDEEFRKIRDKKRRGESMTMEERVMHSISLICSYACYDKNLIILKKCLPHTHPLCANCHTKFHSLAKIAMYVECEKKSQLSLYNTQEFETIYYPIWLREKGVDPNHPILKDWDWNQNFKDHKQLQIDEDIFVEESVETHHIENFIK